MKTLCMGVLFALLFLPLVFSQEVAPIPAHLEKLPLKLTAAKVFGARPCNPIDFWVRCIGQGPYHFEAKNLPNGLVLNSKTGRIQGEIVDKGEKNFTITLSNGKEKVFANYKFIIGEKIQLTPPMGWNSWYCFSESVSDTAIRITATAMRERGLWAYGWTFVNIDDCWQGFRGGKYYAIQGNERFHAMKDLCNHVHAQGCKIGIYSTPWMGTYAGFIGGSYESDTIMNKIYIPESKRIQKHQVYGRHPGMDRCGVKRCGSIWGFDDDVKQWTEWGFDFVKVDWLPNDVLNTKRIYTAMRSSGRDMVLSLSNAAPMKNINELRKYAQLWRTTGDIRDNWNSVYSNGFIYNDQWTKYQEPGAFNDPDMLQIGMIGSSNSLNETYRPSNLTKAEQKSQFALWCMMSSPLLVSCDIKNMDEETYKLLTNEDLLEINQDILAKQAKSIYRFDGILIYEKNLANGDLIYGVFNSKHTPVETHLQLPYISYQDGLFDILAKKAVNPAELVTIPAHDCIILRKNKDPK